MFETLHSERFAFRRFERPDASHVNGLLKDIELAQRIGSVPYPYSLEMGQEYPDHVIGSDDNALTLEKNGEQVGAVSLIELPGFWSLGSFGGMVR